MISKSNKPLRTAAYCRVSTDQELQENSYETQQAYFRSRIASDPAKSLAGIYGDKGKTGRSLHGRTGLQALLHDCEAGLIDLVLVKSLSRFSRNLPDCLTMVRKLKELGIPVIFEKEGINTMEGSGELLLSIMAAIAQEESRSIGENLRWAIMQSNAKGEPFFHPSYGFRRKKDSRAWEIFPMEAQRVRRAFSLAATGRWTYQEILAELNRIEQSQKTGDVWRKKRLAYLLTNVVYMGDCLTNRTYHVYTDKMIVRPNRGERDQYYIEDHHPAIIRRAMFERVQQVMKSGLLHSSYKRRNAAQLALLADERWQLEQREEEDA
ncbi:MAG: recombinase family protein [Clostridia bacterium]|nr:recombinase family protein [Clostridia bacterium]